ncbi:hypothetical protein [Neisseria shayeganii]|uniref:Uncharacterized protein n=1 Tax=Neisseria shayeganii TaxID=607712 RepID=A0A7D7T5W3_9NEIS|nr:hypothetical protein [Neisseria shayeganii]QMT41413.1 hypothetical protein H3L94_05150 [Neisseria shayeganii]
MFESLMVQMVSGFSGSLMLPMRLPEKPEAYLFCTSWETVAAAAGQ